MSDLVHEMALAAAEGLDGASSVVTAAAEALPFESAFHGVTCRFGAMFFADPERALRQIRAALAPGGRAVFAVWAGPERNPFFSELASAVRDVVPDAPTPDPDAPHAFRYAPAGKFARFSARRAGWTSRSGRSRS
jgi:SAM-dependent methyltransferase